MKRLFALIAVFTILPYLSYSQGVGINESSPQSTLDVEGNVAIGSGYSGTTPAPLNGLIVEGNVGIGTSSPASKLNIISVPGTNDGQFRFDVISGDEAYFSMNNGNNWGLQIRSDANSPALGAWTSGSMLIHPYSTSTGSLDAVKGPLAVFNFATERVGIGSNAPVSTLDVEGTTTTNALTVTTGANANYVLQSDASGNASWADPNGLSGLITGVIAGDGLNGGGTTGTVTLNLGGSLSATRTITCGTNNLNVNLNSTGDFHIQDNGSSFLYAGDNGLIGINNTAPAHLLSIGNGSTMGDLTALYVKNTNGTNAAESVSIGLGRSNTHIQGKITASNFADGGFQHGYMSFGTRFNEAIAERMKLDWLGNVLIGGIATPVTSAQGTIHLLNGVAPTANLTNGVILYAIDFNDNPPLNGASSELYVRDEDGNATNLSPHHFEQIQQSEEMAWSYYSENDQLGKEINVDMLRTVRIIEELSGQKLVHISDIGDNPYQKDQRNSRTKESLVAKVEMQGKLIEELQQELKDLRKKVNRKIK